MEMKSKSPSITHIIMKLRMKENRRLGLLSEEQQAELIADEADRLQRLKELAEDEALALKLQEEKRKRVK